MKKNDPIGAAEFKLCMLSVAVAAVFGLLCVPVRLVAQGDYGRGGDDWGYQDGVRSRIPAGTPIPVRINDRIDAADANGQVFSGIVHQDVRDSSGNVAIPRGSSVELLVRRVSGRELALDLDSVNVNGQRYGLEAAGEASGDQGIGANRRTGKYVGGGALLGAIIGGIAGGGKGAAIGAGAGAVAGGTAQVLTHGSRVVVPAESLITFRLERPLRINVADAGYQRDGRHYHQYPDSPDQNHRDEGQ